jgi:hypothetical protein
MTINADVGLRLSAQRALYRTVGPGLVRFTGEIQNKTIVLQFVVLEGTSEDEIEDYRCVGTEILADYIDETIDEQFVTVRAFSETDKVPHLSNLFFCRSFEGASE